MMKLEQAAECLAQLGHPTRLAIVRLLIKAGPEGSPVGDIQRSLRIPGSTLSHHILYLVGTGLIYQKRQGRMLICYPSFQKIDAIIDFLTRECCTSGMRDAAKAQRAAS